MAVLPLDRAFGGRGRQPARQKLEYRLAVSPGVRGVNAKNPLQVSARGVYYPWGAETGFFYGGTFQGTKQQAGIGGGFAVQDDATIPLDTYRVTFDAGTGQPAEPEYRDAGRAEPDRAPEPAEPPRAEQGVDEVPPLTEQELEEDRQPQDLPDYSNRDFREPSGSRGGPSFAQSGRGSGGGGGYGRSGGGGGYGRGGGGGGQGGGMGQGHGGPRGPRPGSSYGQGRGGFGDRQGPADRGGQQGGGQQGGGQQGGGGGYGRGGGGGRPGGRRRY